MSFEDMMSKFKQTSDDKMSDLKKYMDVKRGSANRKGGQPK
jgi:S1 RNA binding domain protein